MTTRPPERWPDWMMAAYCLGTILVGFLGVGWMPSTVLEKGLAEPWPQVYSILLILGGAVALAGIVLRVRRATVFAVIGLALATLIHGLTLMVGGAWQTGLRLAIAPLMMIPAIVGWNFWMTWRSLQGKKSEEK